MKKLTLLSLIAAVSMSTQADVSKTYVEGALGHTDLESNTDTSFSVLGGYELFNQDKLSVAGEIGYNQYIEIESEDAFFGKATNTISSLSFGSKVAYEVMPKLQVFGRLAYEAMSQEVEIMGSSVTASSDEFTYGVGATYEVADKLTVGTQYKYAALDSDTDLSNINVSLGYQF